MCRRLVAARRRRCGAAPALGLVCLAIVAVSPSCAARRAVPLARTQVHGRVLHPDGSPAVGARVIAEDACAGWIHLATEVTTGPGGTFVIVADNPRCRKVRFSAEQRDDYWLRTGEDYLLHRMNGTTPEIEVSPAAPPPEVVIMLGDHGGKVDFVVRDAPSGRFVKADVTVRHDPIRSADEGIMEFGTGPDGDDAPLFLRAGRYRAELSSFDCHGKRYSVATHVARDFEVVEGRTTQFVFSVDIAATDARSSSDDYRKVRRCRF